MSSSSSPQPALLRNVALLAICQSLFIGGQTAIFFIGALIGYELAADKSLATLPVSLVILGTALGTIPASLYMGRVGRRAGFMTGATIGMIGAAICSYAIYVQSFWLFCAGTYCIGTYSAFCQYYRFAVADVAPDRYKARAISWVLAGGVVAAVLGPQLVIWTRGLIEHTDYLASYVTIFLMMAAAFVVVSLVRIPKPKPSAMAAAARPMWRIMTSRKFMVAVSTAMVAYGVMSLMMTATPLAMVGHNFKAEDAGFVIQWHVLGMFAPSFITGNLVNRFGKYKIMLIGAIIAIVSPMAALSGLGFGHFWLAMLGIGLGWNFMFVGATTLLTEVHNDAERAKTQAANDFLVFSTTATASFMSGHILFSAGWEWVNWIALPFCFGALIILIFAYISHQKAARNGGGGAAMGQPSEIS